MLKAKVPYENLKVKVPIKVKKPELPKVVIDEPEFSDEELESEEVSTNLENNGEISFDESLSLFYKYLTSYSGGGKSSKNARDEMNQLRRMVTVISFPEDSLKLSALHNLQNIQEDWMMVHAKKYEPGTVRSYLLTLNHYYDFLYRSKVTPKL